MAVICRPGIETEKAIRKLWKDSTRKLLELINEYSKVAGYKINTYCLQPQTFNNYNSVSLTYKLLGISVANMSIRF